MRSRSNSGVRLDGYARLVHQTILCHQVGEGVSLVIIEDVQCASLDGDRWRNALRVAGSPAAAYTPPTPQAGEALGEPEARCWAENRTVDKHS